MRILIVSSWIVAIAVLSASGAIRAVPLLVPVLALSGALAAIIAVRASARLQARLAAVETRTLITIHLLRAVIGAVFLVELARGILPAQFAMRAGPGDIAIGLAALAVRALAPATTGARRSAIAAWCVLGMLDLVLAVGTAQYLLLVAHDPLMLQAARLPFVFIPTVIVPVMMLSHVVVLARVMKPLRTAL